MNKEKPFKKYDLKITVENRRFYGDEPTWTAESITEKNRTSSFAFGLNWYNYICDDKDRRRFLEDWIRVTRTNVDRDLKLLDKASDKFLIPTYGHMARMKLQGFPFTADEEQSIWAHLETVASRAMPAKVVEVAPAPVEKEGVQERIDAQVDVAVFSIEDKVSGLLRGSIKDARAQDIEGMGKFSSIHFKRLSRALEPVIAELTELRDTRSNKDGADDKALQLLEGYDWVSNRNLKTALAFLEDCQGQANRLAIEKKVQRVRKKKPVDKAKLVRKLKFLPQHKELGLNSIKPVDCLNASEVWVYDTRKRKLGVYRAEFDHSIMIKGSSFIGIAEKSSIQKTLRKPEVQLVEFQKLAKNQLRKWFDSIKGTEHQMKSRTNEHVVLLKSY
jgi:hypothetical protein